MIRAVQSLLLVSASLLRSPLCSNDYDSPGCLAVAKATSHVNRVLYIFFFISLLVVMIYSRVTMAGITGVI
jgi:hypothetical protein